MADEFFKIDNGVSQYQTFESLTTNDSQSVNNKTIYGGVIQGTVLKYIYGWDPATNATSNGLVGQVLKADSTGAQQFGSAGLATWTTLANDSSQTIASVPTSRANTVEHIVQITQGNGIYVNKILVTTNGVTTKHTRYGELQFDADAIAIATNWNPIFPSPMSGTGNSVGFGNNTFVAGSYFGEMSTSTDGVSWTTRTSNFTTQIRTIAYGNGIWVAAGSYAQLRTSTDAITWITQTSNFSTEIIHSAHYADNKWVMTGAYGNIRTSTDAITWVTRTSATVNGMRSVEYANGTWLAAGDSGVTQTSTDAVTWVTGANVSWWSVLDTAHINNKWYAVGYNNGFASSTDLVTWVTQDPGPALYSWIELRKIIYADGRFILSTNYAGKIYSTDAITWVSENPPNWSDNNRSMAYGNSTLVAVGNFYPTNLPATNFQVSKSRSAGPINATFTNNLESTDGVTYLRLKASVEDAGAFPTLVKVLSTIVEK